MTKTNSWSAGYLTRKNSTTSKPTILYEVHLGSQTAVDASTYFFNTSNYSLNFFAHIDGSPQNFTALGIQKGEIESGYGNEIPSIDVILDNVSRTFSTLFNTIDFRGKRIVIRQVYMDFLGNVNDYDLLFLGVLDSPEMTINETKMVVRHSIVDTLNNIIPKDTFFTQCNNRFTGSKCANGISEATLEDIKTGQTIDSVTSQVLFVDAARTEADTYWVPAIIIMTAGTAGNIGVKRRVVAKSGTSITIETPFPASIVAGDTYSIERDCDKTFEECNGKFANAANFRGFKYLPNTMVTKALIK